MRVGSNPEKFNNEIINRAYHRIVIPVYIPNFEGYFENAFEIFKLNMESLLLTVHKKTRITIYNNDSNEVIKNYIDHLYEKHEVVDQVFHSKENLGKINAILASVKGNLEPLITITDSDVFFKHDWQNQVESVFVNFPNAGMVSPVPNSIAFKSFTSNNWFYGLLGRASIKFENVRDPGAMKKFEESLGDGVKLYSTTHLEKYLVLNYKGEKAVMGSGHFVATLRREVFDMGSNSPAFIKIQGGVENNFIDIPNEKLGYLRLSTLNNYAFHLGNISEKWMQDEFKMLKLRNSNDPIINISLFHAKPISKWKIFIGKAIKRILLNSFFKEKYFGLIGLKDGKNY